MAMPYQSVHENSEILNDFGLDNDFGFLDSQYLQSIISVQQQAPAYESNNNDTDFELQNHLQLVEEMPILHLESLRQELFPEQQAQEETVHHDDFNTWFCNGPANRQLNPKFSHHPQLQINTPISSPGWALVQEKEADETQPLDMSWEEMSILSDKDKQHITIGHSICSTTTSAATFPNDTHSKSLQDIRSHSDTALASYFDNPATSMSTSTDGETNKRGAIHRRTVSCHSVDSSVERNYLSTKQRLQQRQNLFPAEEEGLAAIGKATDVSGMLIDLESKLVASLKSETAPSRQQQHEQMISQLLMDSQQNSTSTESVILRSATSPPSNCTRRRDSETSFETMGAVPTSNCSSMLAAGAANTTTRLQQPLNQEEPGIRLVNLLVGCADSVANNNFVLANSILRELSVMVSPYGDTIQRVASYFTYGLAAHMAGTGSGQNLYRALGINEPSANDTFEACQVFCEVCPFMKFGEMATTQAALEAFCGEDNVHLIDLGMTRGSQWLRLLQGLATRNGGPPKVVHLTVVQMKPDPRSTESLAEDDQHGKQLKEFAEKLHLNFSCQLISVERLEQVQAWMLTRESGQAIAVNCSAKLHTLLHQQDSQDTCHAVNHVLTIVHSLRPKLFSLLEQEANHNVSHFLPRFLEALHFYSAMFDSLDATFSRVSPERAKVEQLLLGQEIINILACEGRERTERHERLQHWRTRLMKGGFRSLPLSDLAVLQVKAFLPSLSYGTGFTVLENRARGSLILSWQDRPLFSCSMWTC